MKRVILAAVLFTACLAWAQKPKSKGEIEALQAVQNATTLDGRLNAIDNVLTKFTDTEYKGVLLSMALQAAQQKNDLGKINFYAEQILEKDPKNAQAQATIAFETARRIREYDLDKDQNLAKAEKYADLALANAPSMPKPQSNLTDAEWEIRKKDFMSQADDAKGIVAGIRKKPDLEIQEYKAAVEVTPEPDPATVVRLGQAYLDAGKYDEAAATFDKAISMPNALQQVKDVAAQKKAEALRKKAAAAPAQK